MPTAPSRRKPAAVSASIITPTPKQNELIAAALDPTTRVIGYGGAIRGGKSFGAWLVAMILLQKYPGCRGLFVRATRDDLNRTVVPTGGKLIRTVAPDFIRWPPYKDGLAPCANGSELLLVPANEPMDPDSEWLKGLEINFAVIEEASEVTEGFYKRVQTRLGSWIIPGMSINDQPKGLLICTFNPTSNWPKQVFYDAGLAGTLPSHIKYIPATTRDNPHLPPGYLENLEATLDPEEKARFLDAIWDTNTRQFYSGLEWTHVKAPDSINSTAVPEGHTAWLGYDWGFEHPASCVVFSADPVTKTITVRDGMRFHRMSNREMASDIAKRAQSHGWMAAMNRVYGGKDCWSVRRAGLDVGASPPTVADSFRPLGLQMYRAFDGRVLGWRALGQAMREGRLVFANTPGARMVFDTIAMLERSRLNREDATKMDARKDGTGGDDLADACRYGLVSMLRDIGEPMALGVQLPLVEVKNSDRDMTPIPLGMFPPETRPEYKVVKQDHRPDAVPDPEAEPLAWSSDMW